MSHFRLDSNASFIYKDSLRRVFVVILNCGNLDNF
jgi:hypothetical protein